MLPRSDVLRWTLELHSERRESLAKDCPLTTKLRPWHMYAHKLTYTYIHNNSNDYYYHNR